MSTAAQPSHLPRGRALALLVLAALPSMIFAVALPDEIGGDNFDGFNLTPCDGALATDSSAAADYAAALDLCATATEGSRAPGLISATLSLADGSGTPDTASRRIRSAYGSIAPQRGSTFAMLSTGTAAGSGDAGYVAPQNGYNASKQSAAPSDWLAANSGQVPNLPGCPPIPTTAYDPVMLKLRIRVPNNARSFSFNANYVTADYPEYACTNFTDNFVALLDSSFGAALNPSDKNIATPVSFPGLPFSVNLAKLDNGSFTQCVNGLIGCASSGAQPISTCTGTSQLIGTGMEVADANACSMGQQVGGGTGWYVLRGNVVRGDIIELRLAIWDSGDHSYDSNVVLDNFRWSYQPVQAGGTLVPP